MFRLTSKNKSIVALFLALIAIASLVTGCSGQGIDGNDWLIVQKTCLDDLEAFADGMDEVYSLYIIGSMSKTDFKTELGLLKKQFSLLNELYTKLKAENPVKEGSHSYISKRGTEGMENCYVVLGEILSHSVSENGEPLDPKVMAYTYLAYKQQLTSSISEFVTAVVWLEESSENEQ